MRIVKVFYTPGTNYTIKLMARVEEILPIFTSQFQVKGLDQDDLAQEIRLHVWRKIVLYNPIDYELKTWLKPVIRNFITDLARRANRQKRQPPDESFYCVSEAFLVGRGLLPQEDE